MELRFLEEQEFVADAFDDEDAAGVLVDDGLFVLVLVLEKRGEKKGGHGGGEEKKRNKTNLGNSIFDFFRFAWFDLLGGFIPNVA